MTLIKLNEMQEQLTNMRETLLDAINNVEIEIDKKEGEVLKEMGYALDCETYDQRKFIGISLNRMKRDLNSLKEHNTELKEHLHEIETDLQYVVKKIEGNI